MRNPLWYHIIHRIIVTSVVEHCNISVWALWRLWLSIVTINITDWPLWCPFWVLWCQWLRIVMSMTENCDVSDWAMWRLTLVIDYCDFSDWALWRHASQTEHCDVNSWALWRQWLTLWCQWLNILTSVIEHCGVTEWTLWRRWTGQVNSCERRAWWAGRAHCAQPMMCRGAQDVRVYQKKSERQSPKIPSLLRLQFVSNDCWWPVCTHLFVHCCYDLPISSSLSLFS